MSSLPTLLVKGNVIPQKWDNAEALQEVKPLDHIMKWFADRTPTRLGGLPLKRPETPADRVLILRSETGSGKSTVMPPELYHRFFAATRKNIAVTQPRILTSVEIPRTILPFHTREALKRAGTPDRRPLEMGYNIGYQTGVISKKPIRGLTYMQVGVLAQQLKTMTDEWIMRKYYAIVIDEVHERSIHTDMVIYMLKKFIMRNHRKLECPFVVFTSATFDTQKMAKYFKTPQSVIEVKGASFVIHETFLEYDSKNYIQSALDKIQEIHENNPGDFTVSFDVSQKKRRRKSRLKLAKPSPIRDILVFVAGTAEIKQLIAGVKKMDSPFLRQYPLFPIPLTGDIFKRQTEDYQNIFKPMRDLKVAGKTATRRVIISTNVAETGITIDTLKYVVDTGWQNSSEHNPSWAVGSLIHKPVTRGMARQRRGRCGRKAEGYWHPLYTEAVYGAMMTDQHPEIITSDTTDTLLNLIISDYDISTAKASFEEFQQEMIPQTPIDLLKLDLLDMPSANSLHFALEKLYVLGAIDENCKPTRFGIIAQKFRKLPLESVRMILAGYAWKASIQDLITIAAMLNVHQSSLTPRGDADAFQAALDEGLFTGGFGKLRMQLEVADEFIGNLFIYIDFVKQAEKYLFEGSVAGSIGKLRQWCRKKGIGYNAMLSVIELRDETIEAMGLAGLNPFHNNNLSLIKNIQKMPAIKALKHCIYEGFKLNIATWNKYQKRYITNARHFPIQVESPLITPFYKIDKEGDANPKNIIFDNVLLRVDTRSNIYRGSADRISVLDGYINVDLWFEKP